VVAASVAGIEGVLIAGYGLVLFSAVDKQRLAMGVTTPVFFLLYGVALAYFAWACHRLRSWARAPLVLAQLIQLGVAWSFRGGPSTTVSVLLTVAAVIVLVGVFHPASLAALSDEHPAA
jgi:hypothetical protein